AVRRKPFGHRVWIEECPIDFLRRRTEHSVKPDRVCRHDCFSFRRVRSTLSRMGIDEIDMRAYLAPRRSPGDSTLRSTDARRVHWRSWLLVRGGRGLF